MFQKWSRSTLRLFGMLTGFVAVLLMLLVGTTAANAAPMKSAQPAASSPAATSAAAIAVKKDHCGGSGISKWVPEHWGKAKFGSACESHDFCYSSNTDRLTCDQNLLKAMQASCLRAYGSSAKGESCMAVSKTYYHGVRKGAKGHYHGSGDPS